MKYEYEVGESRMVSPEGVVTGIIDSATDDIDALLNNADTRDFESAFGQSRTYLKEALSVTDAKIVPKLIDFEKDGFHINELSLVFGIFQKLGLEPEVTIHTQFFEYSDWMNVFAHIKLAKAIGTGLPTNGMLSYQEDVEEHFYECAPNAAFMPGNHLLQDNQIWHLSVIAGKQDLHDLTGVSRYGMVPVFNGGELHPKLAYLSKELQANNLDGASLDVLSINPDLDTYLTLQAIKHMSGKLPVDRLTRSWLLDEFHNGDEHGPPMYALTGGQYEAVDWSLIIRSQLDGQVSPDLALRPSIQA